MSKRDHLVKLDRRKKKKKQAQINSSLKKKLFGHLSLSPCKYCCYVFFVDELTIEHIIPLSMGGTNDSDNIALACAPCNHERGKETWRLKRELSKDKHEQYTSQYCRKSRKESV